MYIIVSVSYIFSILPYLRIRVVSVSISVSGYHRMEFSSLVPQKPFSLCLFFKCILQYIISICINIIFVLGGYSDMLEPWLQFQLNFSGLVIEI